MKLKEKLIARNLRKQGFSLNEIKRKTGFTKSSISFWVRDIELTEEQKKELSVKGHSKEVIEKRRITRLKNENSRRQKIIDKALIDVKDISERELWLIGIALYWGEGAKTIRSGVCFSNSDPKMIRIIMEFFKRSCNTPLDKIRGHVHIHPHLDGDNAKKYWSEISEIPLEHFYKTTKQQSRASKKKKDSLPFGTLHVYICNTELFLKIKGWIEGINETKIK